MSRLSSLTAVAVFALLIVMAARSRGFIWLDDYTHLNISAVAVRDPSLLLDVWGRPLMTAVHIPGALLGDALVRATSLLMLLGTALLSWATARRLRIPAPAVAALLVLVQPAAAVLGYSALPETPFALVLALAIYLRAADRNVAAALVASLLPLARVEGVVVLVAWAGVLAWERRWRTLPLLALAPVAWALVGAIVYRDVLWLYHATAELSAAADRPGGGSAEHIAPHLRWSYAPFGFVSATGALVGGLVIGALARRRYPDVLVPAVVATLLGFYLVAWGSGMFGTGLTELYVASLSAPLALTGHWTLVRTFDRPARRSWLGEALAVAALALIVLHGDPHRLIAVQPQLRTSILLVTIVAAAVLLPKWQSPRIARLAPTAVVIAVPVLALATTLRDLRPLPLKDGPLATQRLLAQLGRRAKRVTYWSDPSFARFTGRLTDPSSLRPVTPEVIRRQPVGTLVLWDSHLGPGAIGTPDELQRDGFRVLRGARAGKSQAVLWERWSVR